MGKKTERLIKSTDCNNKIYVKAAKNGNIFYSGDLKLQK